MVQIISPVSVGNENDEGTIAAFCQFPVSMEFNHHSTKIGLNNPPTRLEEPKIEAIRSRTFGTLALSDRISHLFFPENLYELIALSIRELLREESRRQMDSAPIPSSKVLVEMLKNCLLHPLRLLNPISFIIQPNNFVILPPSCDAFMKKARVDVSFFQPLKSCLLLKQTFFIFKHEEEVRQSLVPPANLFARQPAPFVFRIQLKDHPFKILHLFIQVPENLTIPHLKHTSKPFQLLLKHIAPPPFNPAFIPRFLHNFPEIQVGEPHVNEPEWFRPPIRLKGIHHKSTVIRDRTIEAPQDNIRPNRNPSRINHRSINPALTRSITPKPRKPPAMKLEVR